MNIIQQSEMLKDISDDRIKQEMQQPTGQFPLYLVSSEAKRRSDMRQRFKAEADGPPPTSTVQQDLMASLAAQTQAPGLPPGQGNQGIMGPRPSPSGPANIQPTQQFAGGGQVRGFNNGGSPALPWEDSPLGRFLGRFKGSGKHNPNLRGTARMGEIVSGREEVRDPEVLNPNVIPPQYRRGYDDSAGYDDEIYEPPREFISMSPGMLSAPQDSGDSRLTLPPVNMPAINYEGSANRPLTPREIAQKDLSAFKPGASAKLSNVPSLSRTTGAYSPESMIKGNISTVTPGKVGDIGLSQGMQDPLTLLNNVDFETVQKAKLAELNAGEDPYAKIAQKLEDREASLEGARDQNAWMALARAGLGAAAGKSQYAMQNIATGGIQGLDDYAQGKKDITAREDRLLESQTGLTKAQQALGASRRAESYQHGKAMLDAQVARNQITTSEYNARLANLETSNAAKTAQAGITAQDNASALQAALGNQRRETTLEQGRVDAVNLGKSLEREGDTRDLQAKMKVFGQNFQLALAEDERKHATLTNNVKTAQDRGKEDRGYIMKMFEQANQTERQIIASNKPGPLVEIARALADGGHGSFTDNLWNLATAKTDTARYNKALSIWDKAAARADIDLSSMGEGDRKRMMISFLRLGGDKKELPRLLENLGPAPKGQLPRGNDGVKAWRKQ